MSVHRHRLLLLLQPASSTGDGGQCLQSCCLLGGTFLNGILWASAPVHCASWVGVCADFPSPFEEASVPRVGPRAISTMFKPPPEPAPTPRLGLLSSWVRCRCVARWAVSSCQILPLGTSPYLGVVRTPCSSEEQSGRGKAYINGFYWQ